MTAGAEGGRASNPGAASEPTDRFDQAGGLRVAFIGGHGRSGSTLLSRMLGNMSGVFAGGEVCYVWEQGMLRDRLCSCGQPFSRCPFWQAVGDHAFGGWTREIAQRGLELRKAVDRNRYMPMLAAPALFPRFAPKLREYTQMYRAVHQGISCASGARLVIDSSKYPSTGFLLRQVDDLDLRVIHLVRDVHGVAYSWAKAVARPDRDGALMTQYSYRRTSTEWLAFNAMVEGLGALGVPRTMVRYEDLIERPQDVLSRLLRFCDVPGDVSTMFSGDRVTLLSDHGVTGNPMRFQTGPMQLRLDLQWRTAMPASARRTISAGTVPGLLRYGYVRDPGAW